jgi:hypothetical protein
MNIIWFIKIIYYCLFDVFILPQRHRQIKMINYKYLKKYIDKLIIKKLKWINQHKAFRGKYIRLIISITIILIHFLEFVHYFGGTYVAVTTLYKSSVRVIFFLMFFCVFFCEVPNYTFELNVCPSVRLS